MPQARHSHHIVLSSQYCSISDGRDPALSAGSRVDGPRSGGVADRVGTGHHVHADGLLKERTFLSSVHSFIAIVREGHPTTPIAIVSPIFCEAAEDTALGNGLSLSRMRSLLAEAVETRRGAGDGRIQLISGLDLLGPADAADLPDGLHTGRHGRGVLGISIARSSGKPSPCWASRHRYRCS